MNDHTLDSAGMCVYVCSNSFDSVRDGPVRLRLLTLMRSCVVYVMCEGACASVWKRMRCIPGKLKSFQVRR